MIKIETLDELAEWHDSRVQHLGVISRSETTKFAIEQHKLTAKILRDISADLKFNKSLQDFVQNQTPSDPELDRILFENIEELYEK